MNNDDTIPLRDLRPGDQVNDRGRWVTITGICTDGQSAHAYFAGMPILLKRASFPRIAVRFAEFWQLK